MEIKIEHIIIAILLILIFIKLNKSENFDKTDLINYTDVIHFDEFKFPPQKTTLVSNGTVPLSCKERNLLRKQYVKNSLFPVDTPYFYEDCSVERSPRTDGYSPRFHGLKTKTFTPSLPNVSEKLSSISVYPSDKLYDTSEAPLLEMPNKFYKTKDFIF